MSYELQRPRGTIPRSEFGKLVIARQINQIIDSVNAQQTVLPSASSQHLPFGHLVVISQITNAADGGGIYAARRCRVADDATFDPAENSAPADVLEDSGTDDLILINPAEAGASTHIIGDGEYVATYITGYSYGDLDLGIILASPASGIQSIRYNSTTHYLQYTFSTSPAEEDWVNAHLFTAKTVVTAIECNGDGTISVTTDTVYSPQ